MKFIQVDKGGVINDVTDVKSPVIEEEESYVNSQVHLFDLTNHNSEVSKLVGLPWETTSDCFTFNFTKLMDHAKLPCTKRSSLRVSSKIFDPFGFLSAFVIKL